MPSISNTFAHKVGQTHGSNWLRTSSRCGVLRQWWCHARLPHVGAALYIRATRWWPSSLDKLAWWWSQPRWNFTFFFAHVVRDVLITSSFNVFSAEFGHEAGQMATLCFVHFDWNFYSGVPFFNIATSKKWSDPVSFLAFWVENSGYSGEHFFISPLNSYLRTRHWTEPTFRPSRPTNHWKNIAFRDFPNISRVCIFLLLTFAPLYLLSSDSTSLLCFSSSDSTALLCFFNCPYCRKLDF